MENVEVLNEWSNGCEGDSSPECLLLSVPHKDPYDSESSVDQKVQSKSKKRCASYVYLCDFIGKISKAEYVIHTTDNEFTKLQHPSLEQIVEELLDFALVENPKRRKIVNKKKLFDELTVPEIISFWTTVNEELKWLIENFSYDIGPIDFQKMEQNPTREKTTYGSGEQNPPKKKTMPGSGDVCPSVIQLWKKAKTDVCPSVIKLFKKSKMNCFVSDFSESIHLLEKYDSHTIESTSMDEINDQFKHVVLLFAGLLDIPFRDNGQCKLNMDFTEIREEGWHLFRKETPIVVKPDYVLRSKDNAIMMPVEVYAPKVFPDNHGLGISGVVNSSQINQEEMKFKGHHLAQHIGLLEDKVLTNFDLNEFDTPVESVGMFFTKKIIHFSKVKTTHRHMSFFMESLLPLEPMEQKEAKKNDPYLIARKMKGNRRENGLLVTKSQWYIDLSKGTHRNALFIFLLHYTFRDESFQY